MTVVDRMNYEVLSCSVCGSGWCECCHGSRGGKPVPKPPTVEERLAALEEKMVKIEQFLPLDP